MSEWKQAYQDLFEKFGEEITARVRAETQLEETREQLKKIGVIPYIRTQLDLYEFVLSQFPADVDLRNDDDTPLMNSRPLNFDDLTVKTTFYYHYNRWFNVITYSIDPRRKMFDHVLSQLGFLHTHHFCKYIAMLYVHVSKIGHFQDFPPDIITWKDENDVINSLAKWNIRDVDELNAVRFLYRLPNMN